MVTDDREPKQLQDYPKDQSNKSIEMKLAEEGNDDQPISLSIKLYLKL